jgi:hypothetical protein
MSQKIGPREQQLRDMRANKTARQPRETVAAALPKTSGKKPVKRKAKKRTT